MPGFTAYAGLLTLGQPKAGETVVVAAASGPVGATVGQIAHIKGARAVGIAGGPEKCTLVRDVFGFDVALDHRSPTFAEDLREACPDGIDVYFENVGGKVWDAVFPLLNTFARVPVCGLVAQYNSTGPFEGPDRLPSLMRDVLTKSLTIRGFIQREFSAQRPDFYREMAQWIAEGPGRHRRWTGKRAGGLHRDAGRPEFRQADRAGFLKSRPSAGVPIRTARRFTGSGWSGTRPAIKLINPCRL
jgi:NADPH-dependent curcumin reductase CurA